MKKGNIISVITAVLGLAIVVVLVSWFIIKPSPTLIQGVTEATSYKASSKIAGRIDNINVREGDRVRKGDLLYSLGTPEMDAKLRQATAARDAAQAKEDMATAGARREQIEAAYSQLQQAEAGLTLARKTYDRVANLYRDGVVPASSYDEADANLKARQATVAAARAQYEIALNATRSEEKQASRALVAQASGAVSEIQSYLADAYIYSPIDGEISTIIAERGELVGNGYPVITILDLNDIWVTFNIREDMMPKITKGMTFDAFFPALDGNIPLEVYFIASQADFATWTATRAQGSFDLRTFKIKARPVTPNPGLRPGMTAVVNWDNI